MANEIYKLSPHERIKALQVIRMFWIARVIDDFEYLKLMDAANKFYTDGCDYEIGGIITND